MNSTSTPLFDSIVELIPIPEQPEPWVILYQPEESTKFLTYSCSARGYAHAILLCMEQFPECVILWQTQTDSEAVMFEEYRSWLHDDFQWYSLDNKETPK